MSAMIRPTISLSPDPEPCLEEMEQGARNDAWTAAPDCIGHQSGTSQDCWELLPCPAPDSRLPIGPDRPIEI